VRQDVHTTTIYIEFAVSRTKKEVYIQKETWRISPIKCRTTATFEKTPKHAQTLPVLKVGTKRFAISRKQEASSRKVAISLPSSSQSSAARALELILGPTTVVPRVTAILDTVLELVLGAVTVAKRDGGCDGRARYLEVESKLLVVVGGAVLQQHAARVVVVGEAAALVLERHDVADDVVDRGR
jgi:hypothetical protein